MVLFPLRQVRCFEFSVMKKDYWMIVMSCVHNLWLADGWQFELSFEYSDQKYNQ